MRFLRIFFIGIFTIIWSMTISSCDKEEMEDGVENKTDKDVNNNGREYVDLGLSTLWATCNVGAYSSTDIGGKYAFGESLTKSEYTSSNYVGGNIDVAHILWGGDWRIPTRNELEELITKCRWSVAYKNGVEIVKVKGPNGNYIELPHRSYIDNEGLGGWYWSSTSYSTSKAYCLHFDSDVSSGTIDKYYGFLIRPVITNPNYKEDSYDSGDNNNNSGGSSSQYEKPDIGFYDFTATRTSLKVQYKIYNNTKAKVTSAKVYYGTTSNPTKSASTSVSGTLITANISGLKAGTTYYVKCVATGPGGSTTSSISRCITNY